MNPDLPNLVAELLLETFSSVDNAVLKEAQVRLKALYTESPHFFESLLKILTDYNFSTKIKNSAATNLRTFIKLALEDGLLQEDHRIQLLQAVFSVIISPALDQGTRTTLGYSLSTLLSAKQAYPHPGYLPVIAQQILQALQGGLSEITGGLRALKSIFNCIEHSAQVNEMFTAAMPYLVAIGQKGVLQITQAAAAGDVDLISEGVEVLTSWANVVNSLLEHYSTIDDRMMRHLLENNEIPSILTALIVLVLPGDATLISTSSIPTAIQMSTIKIHAVEAFNIALQYLIDNRKKTLESQGVKASVVIGVDLPDSGYVRAARQLTELISNSLILLCNQPDLEEVLQLESVTGLISEMMSMMFKTVSDRSFYQTFANYSRALIVQVCLVLLKVTETDIETFSESPQEFVTAAVDVCEQQESETYKSAAAQLLEGLCDYIDGALSFTVNFAVQAGDFALTGKRFDAIGHYNLLEPFASSVILASTNSEHIIDVCLMALCVVSYAVEKRTDLMKLLEDFLSAHLQSLVQQNSELLNMRLCMLFYFFCESIFEDNDTAFVQLFQFLLNCLIPSLHCKAVNMQACDTLSYIVQEEEVQLRLEGLVGSFISFLIETIPQQCEPAFFDALNEILQSFSDSIEYPFHEISVRLASKIEAETNQFLGRLKEGAKLNALDFTVVVKCYNCLRILLEHENLPKEHLVRPR